jgi:hypothetical protein
MIKRQTLSRELDKVDAACWLLPRWTVKASCCEISCHPLFLSVCIMSKATPPREDRLLVCSRSLEHLERVPVRLNLGMICPHMTHCTTRHHNRLGNGFHLFPSYDDRQDTPMYTTEYSIPGRHTARISSCVCLCMQLELGLVLVLRLIDHMISKEAPRPIPPYPIKHGIREMIFELPPSIP